MEKYQTSIELSPAELVYIASLLGSKVLVGIPDPFSGWLMDEIREVLNEAEAGLIQRNILNTGKDQPFILSSNALALIGALAFPEATFLLATTAYDNDPIQCVLAVRIPLTVEVTFHATGNYFIQAVSGKDALIRRVHEHWHINNQKATPGEPLDFPEESLMKVRSLVNDGQYQQAKEELRRTGMSETGAIILVETLKKPIRSGSIVRLHWSDGNWHTSGIGMLEGENGLWRLRTLERDGSLWVQAMPCDAIILTGSLRCLVEQFMS